MAMAFSVVISMRGCSWVGALTLGPGWLPASHCEAGAPTHSPCAAAWLAGLPALCLALTAREQGLHSAVCCFLHGQACQLVLRHSGLCGSLPAGAHGVHDPGADSHGVTRPDQTWPQWCVVRNMVLGMLLIFALYHLLVAPWVARQEGIRVVVLCHLHAQRSVYPQPGAAEPQDPLIYCVSMHCFLQDCWVLSCCPRAGETWGREQPYSLSSS